jgi:hypothetical protein
MKKLKKTIKKQRKRRKNSTKNELVQKNSIFQDNGQNIKVEVAKMLIFEINIKLYHL